MSRPWMERMRDYVDGRLDAVEAEAFLAETRTDPERVEMLDTFALVHRATADDAPLTSTTFEDLALSESAASPQPVMRRAWLAAAVLLLAAGAWWFGTRDLDRPPVVELRSLALDARGPDLEAPLADLDALPDDAHEYRTADEHGLVWNVLLEDARHLARFSGRRVLLFVEFPGCPWCLEYDKDEFRSKQMIGAAEDFVLVRLDWRETPKALAHHPNNGWPLFFVLDPAVPEWEAAPVATLKGEKHDADALGSFLQTHAVKGAPTWDAWREGVLSLRVLDDDSSLAAQYAAWARVADFRGALGTLARWNLERLNADASAALRSLSGETDESRRRARLTELVARYAGTPHADDWRRIAAAYEASGWPGFARSGAQR